MDMEVLSTLAVVLRADFDETITETTVSVGLSSRDLSREPTQCEHCIKTPLCASICKGQAPLHVASEIIGS